MKLFFVLAFAISFHFQAQAWPDDVVKELKNQAGEQAARVADVNMDKLVSLAKTKEKIVLTKAQKALAFHVFFGIEQEKEFRRTSVQISGRPYPMTPIVIWINTEKRKGNSMLMSLIGEVLERPVAHYHMYEAGEATLELTAIRDNLADGKTVILDDFSFFYRSIKPGYFRRLLNQIESNAVLLAVNDNPAVDHRRELESSISYVTPEIDDEECDLTLTELFKFHSQPTSKTLQ